MVIRTMTRSAAILALALFAAGVSAQIVPYASEEYDEWQGGASSDGTECSDPAEVADIGGSGGEKGYRINCPLGGSGQAIKSANTPSMASGFKTCCPA